MGYTEKGFRARLLALRAADHALLQLPNIIPNVEETLREVNEALEKLVNGEVFDVHTVLKKSDKLLEEAGERNGELVRWMDVSYLTK